MNEFEQVFQIKNKIIRVAFGLKEKCALRWLT